MRCFIVDAPICKDIEAAQIGLEEVQKVIYSGNYDMVILDEINIALYYNSPAS